MEILYKIEDSFYKIKRFLKNAWRFRNELSNFYDWNYDLGLFRRSLELNVINIETKSYEVPESKDKKVLKMKRAIFILKCFEEDNFIELAEEELGLEFFCGSFNFEKKENDNYYLLEDNNTEEQKENNRLILMKSIEIQDNLWSELWRIIQGQDNNEFKIINEDKPVNREDWFDGSGLYNWWN